MQGIEMLRHRQGQLPQQTLILRNGQIVKGSITRLYPNNRAEVQIASHRVIAEILTPLRVGEQYFFQVNQDKASMIQLQVLNEAARADSVQSIEQLISLLGVRASKRAVSFVQQLMNDKVPFDRAQMNQAILLLERLGYTQSNREIVREMLLMRLPMTENVFHALSTVKSEQLSTLMEQLVHALKRTPSLTEAEANFLRLFEQLTNRFTRNELFHPLFQSKYSSLQSLLNIQNPLSSSGKFSRFNEMGTIIEALQRLVENGTAIERAVRTMIEQFPSLQRVTFTQADVSRLGEMVRTQLLPLLPNDVNGRIQAELEQVVRFTRGEMTSSNIRGLQAALTALSNTLHSLLQNATYVQANQLSQQPTGASLEQLINNRAEIEQRVQMLLEQFPSLQRTNISRADVLQMQETVRTQLFSLLPNVVSQKLQIELEQFVRMYDREQDAVGQRNVENMLQSLRQTISTLLQNETYRTVERLTAQQLTNMSDQLAKNRAQIEQQVRSMLEQLSTLQGKHVTQRELSQLQETMTTRLVPILPNALGERLINELQSLISTMEVSLSTSQVSANNVSESLVSIGEMLRPLLQEETYIQAREVLQQSTQNQFSQLSTQTQFLSHLYTTLQTLGLQHEHTIATTFQTTEAVPEALLQTLKSFVIQMSQDATARVSDQATTLLHFLNGLQLQAVQESAHFFHATLALPGEKLALNRDLYMQFEGQRKTDGSLDPNHCRVLFVLTLEHLQETIVDMQVQKRVVTVTVFNDFVQTPPHFLRPFEDVLSTNLEHLGYTLSAVRWKKLHERTLTAGKVEDSSSREHPKEGFDLRV